MSYISPSSRNISTTTLIKKPGISKLTLEGSELAAADKFIETNSADQYPRQHLSRKVQRQKTLHEVSEGIMLLVMLLFLLFFMFSSKELYRSLGDVILSVVPVILIVLFYLTKRSEKFLNTVPNAYLVPRVYAQVNVDTTDAGLVRVTLNIYKPVLLGSRRFSYDNFPSNIKDFPADESTDEIMEYVADLELMAEEIDNEAQKAYEGALHTLEHQKEEAARKSEEAQHKKLLAKQTADALNERKKPN